MAKSKIVEIDGKNISFEYDKNNRITGAFDHTDPSNPASIDPTTNEFNDVVSSRESLTLLNFQKFGGNKESYTNTVSLATQEELNAFHEKQSPESKAKLLAESLKESLVDQSVAPEPPPTSAYAAYKRGRKTGGTDLFTYPLDIDLQQDHFKISKYSYKRNEVTNKSDSVVQGSRPKRVETKTINNGVTEKFLNLFRSEEKIVRPIELERVVEGDSMLGNQFLGSVILPMPKVVDTNGCEWGESELNIFGLAAVAGAEQGQKIIGNKFLGRFGRGKNIENVTGTGASKEDLLAVEAITERTKRGGSFIKDFKRFGSAVANAAAAEATARVTGQSVSQDQFLARTSGRVLNPNAELLFQGPVLRDFNFDFLMIARSQNEGKEIRKIIRWFKSGMAPKFNSSTFLKTPDIFTLDYRKGNGDGAFETLKTVNRFSPGGLALRTIAVDYAVNGYWSAYTDSQPVAVKMSLNFAELRPIYAGDQNDENLVDSVGF